MAYIDGFVLAVPTKNRARYKAFAMKYAKVFREYGATRVVEAWGDELPKGKWTDFRMAVKAKKSESVVFAWVEWPSKKARNAGMKRLLSEPQPKSMPFDGKRMIYGGFAALMDI